MKKLLSLLLASVLMVSGLHVTYAEPLEEPVGDPPVEQTDLEYVDPSTVKKPVALPYSGHADKFGENSDDEQSAIYDDDDLVRVSIQLNTPSTLDAGYSAEDIANNSSAMDYRDELQNEQKDVENAIIEKGVDMDVVWNLTLAANIISADVKYGEIRKIEEIGDIKQVFVENYYEPLRNGDEPNTSNSTKEMVYATQAWANGYTGAGTKVAIIDTGTNDAHSSFDSGAFEYALTQDGKSLSDYDLLDKEDINSVLENLNIYANGNLDADSLYLNSKLPFAYNYIDGDYEIDHSHDTKGEHGSHVAGIAAANRYVSDGNGGYVDAASTVYAVGVAPDAQIITMKVFGKGGGAYDSDYMAAIEDAIILGADSINLSLGSGNPGMAYSTEYQEIMDGLKGKGAVVVMSAGNSFSWNDTPWPYDDGDDDPENDIYFPYPGFLYVEDISFDTVGSPGSFNNSLAVASADNIGMTGMPLIFDGSVNAFYNETSSTGARMKSIAGTYDYVYIDGVGESAEYETVNKTINLEGKIVIVNRGGLSFYVKGSH